MYNAHRQRTQSQQPNLISFSEQRLPHILITHSLTPSHCSISIMSDRTYEDVFTALDSNEEDFNEENSHEETTDMRRASWTPSPLRGFDIDELIAAADRMEHQPIRRYTSMGDRPHLRHRRSLSQRLRSSLSIFRRSSSGGQEGRASETGRKTQSQALTSIDSTNTGSASTRPAQPHPARLRVACPRRSSIEIARRPSPTRRSSSSGPSRPLNFQPGALNLHTEPLHLDGAESSPDTPLSPWRASRVRYDSTTHVGTFDAEAPPAEQYSYRMRTLPYPQRRHPSVRVQDYLRFMEALVPQIGASEVSSAFAPEPDIGSDAPVRTPIAQGPISVDPPPWYAAFDQEVPPAQGESRRLDSVAVVQEDVPSTKFDDGEKQASAGGRDRRGSGSSQNSSQSVGGDQGELH